MLETSAIDRERAGFLLREAGYEGFVAATEVGVRYCANWSPVTFKMGRPERAFAIVPSDPKRPVGLVVFAPELWLLTAARNAIEAQCFPYTTPAPQGFAAASIFDAVPRFSPPPAAGVELTKWEEACGRADDAHGASMAPTAESALGHALRMLGLWGGRLAIDDWGAALALHATKVEAELCYDDGLFRRMRLVKSPAEQAAMGRAAAQTAACLEDTIAALRVGMSAEDGERAFAAACARRGGSPAFIAFGSLGTLRHGEFVAGEPFMIDASARFDGYHGDHGRTLVFGAPPEKLERRISVLDRTWSRILGELRPGVSYDDIRGLASSAYAEFAAAENGFGVNPHSVGLQHTDEPYRASTIGLVKDNLVLEAGMTMTVDLPFLATGWGMCHFEELVLIETDGARRLTPPSASLRVLEA